MKDRAASAIHLAKHDVERADYRDHVRYKHPAAP